MEYLKKNSTSVFVDVHKGTKVLKTIEMPQFEMKASSFVRKSTVIYGTSGSGKTYLIRDIMYLLKDRFPRVWVFCPTNAQNQMYTGIVPEPLIYDTVTLEIISDIYEYQEMARQIYDTANKIETLRKLFMRIPENSKAILFETKLINLRKTAMSEIDAEQNGVKREELKDKLDALMNEKLCSHYKQFIGANMSRLAGMDLTEDEKYSLKYIGYCPDSLVIFDDAMTEVAEVIKRGKKEENPAVQNFFFKGRHILISTIYALQSEKMFDPALRKNTFTSIFTSSDEAMGYFGKSSNGFAAEEKRDAQACITTLFSPEHKPTHKKLVYLKDCEKKYQYVIAQPHTRFPMCGKSVRDYCKKIEEKSKSIDKKSKFAKKFCDYAGGHSGNRFTGSP